MKIVFAVAGYFTPEYKTLTHLLELGEKSANDFLRAMNQQKE